MFVAEKLVTLVIETVVMALDISEQNLTQLKVTNARVGALEIKLKEALKELQHMKQQPQRPIGCDIIPCYTKDELDRLEASLYGSSNKELMVRHACTYPC